MIACSLLNGIESNSEGQLPAVQFLRRTAARSQIIPDEASGKLNSYSCGNGPGSSSDRENGRDVQ